MTVSKAIEVIQTQKEHAIRHMPNHPSSVSHAQEKIDAMEMAIIALTAWKMNETRIKLENIADTLR